VLIGVASGADTESQIATFKSHYGLDNVVLWIDVNKVYRDIVEPGGRSYPIEVVIDRKGIVLYIETDYLPGQAAAAAEAAIKE